MNKYKPVIGLEIHVELKTKSKMFCSCDADYFGKEPNTNVCPVCLGLPGALPVPNKKAIEWTILIGKALNCKINSVSKFDRKHYFYPDLAKGYQISQYDEPIASKGWLKVKTQNSKLKSENNETMKQWNIEKNFRITRVHLEEDTGKLIHKGTETLVDFNRSGVPLVEIVTEPDFDNAEDVKVFLEELHTIIRYLDVSDADMEKGSMRMEPNISVAVISAKAGNQEKTGSPIGVGDDIRKKLPNYKVEVKNINSFNFVKKAIEYEVDRQTDILEKGELPAQETRGYDSKKGVTYSQRSKEAAHDYRYFPEPDIPPMSFSDEFMNRIKVPELPQQRIDRYMTKGIKFADAFTLVRDRNLGERFEKVLAQVKHADGIKALDVANVLINRKELEGLELEEIYRKLKEIKGPKEVDEKALEITIKHLIEINKKAVEDYKSGKENAIMFLVGAVMREMKGKADANLVISKLKAQISNPNRKS